MPGRPDHPCRRLPRPLPARPRRASVGIPAAPIPIVPRSSAPPAGVPRGLDRHESTGNNTGSSEPLDTHPLTRFAVREMLDQAGGVDSLTASPQSWSGATGFHPAGRPSLDVLTGVRRAPASARADVAGDHLTGKFQSRTRSCTAVLPARHGTGPSGRPHAGRPVRLWQAPPAVSSSSRAIGAPNSAITPSLLVFGGAAVAADHGRHSPHPHRSAEWRAPFLDPVPPRCPSTDDVGEQNRSIHEIRRDGGRDHPRRTATNRRTSQHAASCCIAEHVTPADVIR